jgi:siroheme synthase-like protein
MIGTGKQWLAALGGLIVGGGAVAARKARALLECGATRVRVISTEFSDDLPTGVERVRREYQSGDVDDASLVFAATDRPDVNARIVADARGRGIFANRADDDEEGDFITPAMHHAGAIQITVSAGSAALTARIRDEVAARLDPRWQQMAEVMRALRPRISRRRDLSPARRRDIFHALASNEAMNIAMAGPEAVWAWVSERFSDALEPGAPDA